MTSGKITWLRLTEDFLCAGTPALLISVARFYPEWWYLSLFGLVPFLWRATRVHVLEALMLGVALGVLLCSVSKPLESWSIPLTALLHLLAVASLFAVYAVIVNGAARFVGLNAALLAVIWLPIEYGFYPWIHQDDVFGFVGSGSAILVRAGSLFGALMVSFLVILINWAILVLAQRILRALRVGGSGRAGSRPNEPRLLVQDVLLETRAEFTRRPRAPPSIAVPILSTSSSL